MTAERIDADAVLGFPKFATQVSRAQTTDFVLVQIPHVGAHQLGIGMRCRPDAVDEQRGQHLRTIVVGHSCLFAARTFDSSACAACAYVLAESATTASSRSAASSRRRRISAFAST